MTGPVVALDGRTRTCGQVRDLARGAATAVVTREGRERAAAAARTAAEVAASRGVYGRTTGVGANLGQAVAADGLAEHGLRLARSHAGGSGPLVAGELSRAMLAVRANQLAAGGSGVDPGVLGPLVAAVNAGLAVPVPRYGAIGTGDLTALAVTALCLLGERDWQPGEGPQPRFALASADVLRLRRIRPAGPSLAAAFGLAAGTLPASTADRALDSDLEAAQNLLPGLAGTITSGVVTHEYSPGGPQEDPA